VLPDLSVGVTFPAILKSCATEPTLRTRNMTAPWPMDRADSLIAKSFSVTLTVMPAERAPTGAADSTAATIAAAETATARRAVELVIGRDLLGRRTEYER